MLFRSNPYAIGMAQAMKSTGDKPPLKKSTINKAHKIAKKIDEAISPANPALDSICHRYGKECKDFMTSGMMDPDLYHALHDHYYDEMPAAVKRGDNTKEWVEDQFHSDMGGMDFDGGDDSLSTLPVSVKLDSHDRELDELAKLAGLHAVEEASCNMTAEGEYCPEHGMMECGMGMYEGKGSKPDYIDLDKDGDKKEPMKKAAKDKEELDECGVPMSGGGMDEQDGMSVSTSVDTRTGRKTINISADGETAEQIAQILKMAGLAAHNEVHGGGEHMHMHQEQPQVIAVAEEWANKAEVDYEDVDAITDQGGDLNKKKKQDPHTANKAANPLKEGENEVINRLQAMYSRFKKN